MLNRLVALPLLLIIAGVGAAAMYLPFLYSFFTRDWFTARAFFYSASIFLFVFSMLAIATSDTRPRVPSRSHLVALVASFSALPVMLAVPVYEAIPGITFFDAYIEMVSSFTTTGAPFLGHPANLAEGVHLWRALVGWMGGLLVWVTAVAILAPMNLGGFEVTGQAPNYKGTPRGIGNVQASEGAKRLLLFTRQFTPIYVSLTLILCLSLMIAGESPFVAICHAMSTLATSGISPVGGLEGSEAGTAGEAILFFFLFLAISRETFSQEKGLRYFTTLNGDAEFRLGLFCVLVIPTLLFLRHWVGAIEGETIREPDLALRALWGGVFTVLSFLSTTGFETASWDVARAWSGLGTPGLILMGLAVIGGGVATTAGGVKLLRVYALYMHGRRELDRLVHPSSVGGSGVVARRIRREGAYIAWIFFMLFAMSVAIVMLALAFAGLDFESATVLTVAALSTTGPLGTAVSGGVASYAALPIGAKAILAFAMVLGRLETLAIIALINPAFWRR